MVSSLVVYAQTKHTGKITGSDDKLPVVGASVRIKGTTIGTQTDVNGTYSISVKAGDVLVVSYIGYTTQEVTVGASETINVVLQAGSNSLNEVVVTGYTSQRKKDISGAVATVDVGAATKLPTASSDQLLQGQASGVTVVTNGQPGSSSQVYVRGIGNFANSQPLYVIDGVQTNNMNDVNPNDIESMSVLKDAGATAIYGIAGGNGVVVITTKKGKVGKSVFTYDAYYGTQRPLGGNVWNVLNGADYGKLLAQVDPTNPLLINGKIADYGYQAGSNLPAAKGVANEGAAAVNPSLYRFDPQNPNNDYLIQKFNNGAGTDWFHEVFKPAPMQSHTISGSGANDKNSYFFSLGYLNQRGTLIDSYFKRYQARINTTFNIKDFFRIGENAQIYYNESPGSILNNDEGNPISYTYRIQPQIPVYDIGGNYGGTWAGPTQLGNANNPVAIAQRRGTNKFQSFNIVGSAFAEVDFLKNFTARTSINGSINSQYYQEIRYNTYENGESHTSNNGFLQNSRYYTNYNWSNILTYSKIVGKHNVKVLAGYEQKEYRNRFIEGSGTNLFSVDPNYANLSNVTANRVLTGGVDPNSQPTQTQSVFARLDYIFNDRYILGATIRRDGFSAFAPGRKWGSFPSVSLAWRASQEDFLKTVEWLTDLKIRGSYGVSGFNANVRGDNAFNTFASDPGGSYYAIGGGITNPATGFFAQRFGNLATSWEKDKVANVGFDASIMGGKFDMSLEYFKKTSSDLLFGVTLPATVGGATEPIVNVGSVTNQGIEAAFTYHGKPSADFTYNVGVNITTYKNKITELNTNFFNAGSRIGNIVYQQVGSPIGAFYGYKVAGYFRDAADVAASPTQDQAAPGRFKYQDTNGDGVISDADRTVLGNPNPDFTYGLNLSAAYKGFDFTAVFYGSQGNDVFNYTKYWTHFYSSLTGNKSNDLLYNAWSPTNLNPKAPKAEAVSTFSTDAAVNSFYVENGSFLKLRTLQIGYDFGASILSKLGVKRLHAYIQGTNLFTVTKYTGLDPEVQAGNTNGSNGNSLGIDYGNYPNNEKRYILGVNLSF
ncbi:TonB-dependent receptor [Mucilaginibacter pallidiroseus]|uniref:TonB-dependent receptor n=2 Tax=Mucilaginibacter pallidiroseus TaxID=2599295 RepID=A0A563U3J1_9SPHI|nr:TonB-dependent receptor [Mucilaginibacter pallidiroseus]